MQKVYYQFIVCFLGTILLQANVFGNVTSPFEVVIEYAENIALVEIVASTDGTLRVRVIETYRGNLRGEVVITRSKDFLLSGGAKGNRCIVALDEDRRPFITSLGCGIHNILTFDAEGKLTTGIYRYDSGFANSAEFSDMASVIDNLLSLVKSTPLETLPATLIVRPTEKDNLRTMMFSIAAVIAIIVVIWSIKTLAARLKTMTA